MMIFNDDRLDSRRPARRPPVDDAYTEWFNAHSRCTVALREWCAASSEDREAAYRAYVAALLVEEAAADRLESLNAQAA